MCDSYDDWSIKHYHCFTFVNRTYFSEEVTVGCSTYESYAGY